MDGLLDLLITFSDSSNKLYQNKGDSTFVNIAPLVGLDSLGFWSSATWADPSNRGVPDIYLANRNGANRYYKGRTGGS